MIIHVYALCWNEEKMLPYFFRHYDSIADRYYIFDNGSTDNSLFILQSNPKVSVDKLKIQGDSLIEALRNQYNHIWKKSKNIADWVIICNIDEHIYYPNIREYLQRCIANDITIVIPRGYEMISDVFPDSDKPLYETIQYGVRNKWFDKPQIFNPNEIKDINFSEGRHFASPVGNVKKEFGKNILLLHYKYIGFNYFNNRLFELQQRLRKNDITNKLGYQYLWNEREKLRKFENMKKIAFKVI